MRRKRRSNNGALRRLSSRSVLAFKIRNRRGYATMALGFLTEGRTLSQAYSRLIKACRRKGMMLPEETLPPLRRF